jgi:predicted nucleic acid-binding protein
LNRLDAFFRWHRPIALDTNIFIYQLEGIARHSRLTDAIFAWLELPGSHAVTSTVTMTELLVQPYRNSDEQRVDEIFALLSTYPNLVWITPSLEIAALAARLRALHRLRMPDAIQAATAVHAHAAGLITNDAAFERVDAFETLVLNRL